MDGGIWNASNLTTTASPGTTGAALPQYAGFIAAGVSVVVFGSMFIPVKKFETGDGLFFQLIACLAIWVPSVILHAFRGFPRFWPLAMLGGALWCTGNILCVPIIQCVGMAMGMLVWGITNMLIGWASGRFGWFGLHPEVPHNEALNYLGVGLCVCSAFIVALVKPTIVSPVDKDKQALPSDEERSPLLVEGSNEKRLSINTEADVAVSINNDNFSFTEKLPPNIRKAVGIAMCIVAGVFFGANFAPVIYIKDNYGVSYGNCTVNPCLSQVSSQDLDYVFSHFTGILLTSIFYFLVYCVYMKNKPRIYSNLVLPAFASGTLWSIADISFFLANEVLAESVAFPIISGGPGIVASLWGVLVFKEIQGKRNIIILGVAFCFVIAGSILCGISK